MWTCHGLHPSCLSSCCFYFLQVVDFVVLFNKEICVCLQEQLFNVHTSTRWWADSFNVFVKTRLSSSWRWGGVSLQNTQNISYFKVSASNKQTLQQLCLQSLRLFLLVYKYYRWAEFKRLNWNKRRDIKLDIRSKCFLLNLLKFCLSCHSKIFLICAVVVKPLNHADLHNEYSRVTTTPTLSICKTAVLCLNQMFPPERRSFSFHWWIFFMLHSLLIRLVLFLTMNLNSTLFW